MSALETLIQVRPALHRFGGRDVSSYLTNGTLRWLEQTLRPEMRTLETGCGASTVVFASARTAHAAVSPDPVEHERILEYCRAHGINADGVTFHAGTSDCVLPMLDGGFDLVLVDGAHSFPFPVLDVYYASRLLRVGGNLVVDDAPFPAVGVALRHLELAPEWERVAVLDDRAVVWKKVAEEDLAGDPCFEQAFNRRYPDFGFLPWRRRVVVTARTQYHQARVALGRLARRQPRPAVTDRRRV